MNTLVNFEISCLMKEKGIKIDTDEVIFYRDEVNNIEEHQIKNRDVLYNYTGFDNYIPDENEYQTYMIAEVVMWLYEKHDVWVSVQRDWDVGKCLGFEAIIDDNDGSINTETFNSPTEAYSSAILYTLNNLI